MMQVDGEFVKFSLIYFNVCVFLWEFHLNLREILTIVRARIPQHLNNELSPEIVRRSRSYSLNKLKLWMLENIQRIIIVVWILHQDILIYFYEYLMLYTGSYLILNLMAAYVFFTGPWLVSLPFRIYDSFSENNVRISCSELMKTSIKTMISAHTYYVFLFILLILMIFISMNTGLDYCCIFVFCMLVTFVQVGMDTLYPSIIASWFNKYTPLEDGSLRTQVQELYLQCGVECLPIYVRDSSTESCSNLALIDGSVHKKLIINNILLTYDTNLALSIIAHEIGHWKLQHYRRVRDANFIVNFLFLIFFLYMIRVPELYFALGFYLWRPQLVAAFALFHFVKVPLFRFINYFYLYRIYRKHEIDADNFVIEQKRGADLREAVLKIWSRKPIFPIMNLLYKKWFYNNLPLVERLNNIDLKISKSR